MGEWLFISLYSVSFSVFAPQKLIHKIVLQFLKLTHSSLLSSHMRKFLTTFEKKIYHNRAWSRIMTKEIVYGCGNFIFKIYI